MERKPAVIAAHLSASMAALQKSTYILHTTYYSLSLHVKERRESLASRGVNYSREFTPPANFRREGVLSLSLFLFHPLDAVQPGYLNPARAAESPRDR